MKIPYFELGNNTIITFCTSSHHTENEVVASLDLLNACEKDKDVPITFGLVDVGYYVSSSQEYIPWHVILIVHFDGENHNIFHFDQLRTRK